MSFRNLSSSDYSPKFLDHWYYLFMNKVYGFFLYAILINLALNCFSKGYAFSFKTRIQKSFPKYFMSNGNIQGVCSDIIKAVERIIKKKIIGVDQFMPFKRIQNNLEHNIINIFFCMAKNEIREKKYIFINPPLYEVNHVVAIRKGDKVNIKSFDDIRKLGIDGKILSNFGTATENFLKKQKGLIIDSSAKNLTSNFKKLIAGRGRLVYFHDIGLISTIKKNNLEDRVRILPYSYKKYFHYVVFSKNVKKKYIIKIKQAIKKLKKSGELAKILNKYTKL